MRPGAHRSLKHKFEKLEHKIGTPGINSERHERGIGATGAFVADLG